MTTRTPLRAAIDSGNYACVKALICQDGALGLPAAELTAWLAGVLSSTGGRTFSPFSKDTEITINANEECATTRKEPRARAIDRHQKHSKPCS